MLSYLKTLSTKRIGWILLLLSVFALEGTALYFQHGMALAPCVMCIYERVALMGIGFSGFLGMLFPRFNVTRILALLIGLGSAIKGLTLALQHLDYQMNPGPWNQCSTVAEFPQTLPLDQWFPSIFQPYGSCSDNVWEFLGVSIVQWIVVMFAFYVVLFALLLISQFKRSATNRTLFK